MWLLAGSLIFSPFGPLLMAFSTVNNLREKKKQKAFRYATSFLQHNMEVTDYCCILLVTQTSPGMLWEGEHRGVNNWWWFPLESSWRLATTGTSLVYYNSNNNSNSNNIAKIVMIANQRRVYSKHQERGPCIWKVLKSLLNE